MDAVGAALHVLADVLGASLDDGSVPSQGGRSAALEAVEPPARHLGVAIRFDQVGNPITRLECGAHLDQDCALELATEYATARVQFDRPIASFQAIRHKAVDMLHRLELARVGTHYAAWTSDVDDPGRERAAAMAKGFVAEAAVFISAEDIQIHGGVGFTWDCDAHLYYKRAKMNDAMLGYQGWQRQRLADLLLATA